MEETIDIGGGDETRQCFGDSGGPAFMTVQGDHPAPQRVVGVASQCVSVSGCEQDGVRSVRVSVFRDWIDQEMRDRCQDGTRAWCEVEGLPSQAEIEDTGWAGDSGVNEAPTGCACSSGKRPGGGGAAVLGLLALVGSVSQRRRRDPAGPALD